MTFNPLKAKEQNDKINALLMAEPEYKEIQEWYDECQYNAQMVGDAGHAIDKIKAEQKVYQDDLAKAEAKVLELLIALEAKTGFGKAPGIAHLRTTPESYEIVDTNAVPAEYVVTKMTSSVDKKKLNEAIKAGTISKDSNWLKVNPARKTVAFS